MTPFFSPAPNPRGPPKVYLAAVGEHMTRTAGEMCDGVQPHAFTTARYLREQIALYGSTPSYRTVLELHGMGELGVERNRLSRGRDPDRWARMGELLFSKAPAELRAAP